MRALAVLCALAGCGRLDFGTTTTQTTDAQPPPDEHIVAPFVIPCVQSHPDALLCEGFEDPAVAWDYAIETFGKVSRSTAIAAEGAGALDVRTEDASDYKEARWGKNGIWPSVTTGSLYIREWFYMPSSTVVSDQLSILVSGSGSDPFPSVNVLLTPGEMHVVVEGTSVDAAGEFPRDRWTCLELHVVVGATNGAVDLALDGNQILQKTGIDTAVAGGYTNLDVGVHYATPMQGASHMWIDEVVADRAPIHCN